MPAPLFIKNREQIPAFSPTEDYYVAGSYVANPATSTMVIMQTLSGAYALLATGQSSEYYIVASTTNTIANIINGNAFDIVIAADYASTSPASVGVLPPPWKTQKIHFTKDRSR